MQILVRLGELFGATKLIPIRSAHVSGVSYKTLGDAPVEFLQALADAEAKTKVNATLNPQSYSPEYLASKLPSNIRLNQTKILEQFERIGFSQSLTCTPYYLEKPEQGAHLAWAESSAVVYANSVLGARTNREGGPSALAAAVIGKTPDHGMHQPENRTPNIQINLGTKPKNEAEFGALGVYLGKILSDKVPVIRGLGEPSEEQLKQLCAALATTGMTNMFHRHNPHEKTENIEKMTVEAGDLKQTYTKLSTAPISDPDLVFIGCPHCSVSELGRVCELLKDRKVSKDKEFWVCTSRCVKNNARQYARQIEKARAHVLTDMCTVVSWTELLGIKTIMTNSAKTAYYAPTLNKAETILAPMEDCVKAATKG